MSAAGRWSRLVALVVPALVARLGAPAAAPAQQASDSPPGWDALVEHFEDYVAAAGIVGGAAVAVRNGSVVARLDHGFADLSAGVPAGEGTIYHWGSITKTLTAIAIMQLRDRGLLSLEDRVTYWVPELRQVHDPFGAIDGVTVEMLLSHTAGFQGPTWPWTEGHDWEPFEPTTWEQLVAMMPYQQLHFRPGSQYSYSNPAFLYLARIIEELTGDAWESYVQKNILSPLGLAHSYFGTTPYWLADHRSHNYTVEPDPAGGMRVIDNGADFDPGITIPNGGWNAPIEDLVTYAAFLTGAADDEETLARREFVLSREALREMWVPRVTVAGEPGSGQSFRMGLSFFLVEDGDRSVIGHTGSQAGFRAFFYFEPDSRTAVILVFNTENLDPPEEASAAHRDMLRAAYAVVDP